MQADVAAEDYDYAEVHEEREARRKRRQERKAHKLQAGEDGGQAAEE